MNPSIWDMLTSRKAVVMLVSIACVTVLAALGKVSGSEALEFSKWVVMVWIGAQAVVDATSRALPQGRVPPDVKD